MPFRCSAEIIDTPFDDNQSTLFRFLRILIATNSSISLSLQIEGGGHPRLTELTMAKSTVNPTNPVSPKAQGRSEASVWVLAVAAGVGVANVYYIQPILPLVRDTFSAGSEQVGLAPALTQAGYAAGMLFLAPLGDLVDRRCLIIIKALLLIAALIVVAGAPTWVSLLVASVAGCILGRRLPLCWARLLLSWVRVWEALWGSLALPALWAPRSSAIWQIAGSLTSLSGWVASSSCWPSAG